MQTPREDIMAALFARLESIEGLATTSRRLKHWADVPSEEQPALFMAQGNQIPEVKTGQPMVWRLPVTVYVYVKTTGEQVPASVLNPILDAIEAALPLHPITGLHDDLGLEGVEWARISGPIETSEGTLGDQEVAMIPIEILAT